MDWEYSARREEQLEYDAVSRGKRYREEQKEAISGQFKKEKTGYTLSLCCPLGIVL